MATIRGFRTGDVPALADLWNRAVPAAGSASPLEVHEFDGALICRQFFEAEDLLVAVAEDGRPVGMAHAAFGPVGPEGKSHALDAAMGTVAMLLVDPDRRDPDVADALFAGAVARLRARGAQVVYAGGQAPLNPFYWGLYGGSEYAGVLDAHEDFSGAALRAGFRAAATTRRYELELAALDQVPRDPRLAVLKRQTEVEIDEDCRLESWWDAMAIGSSRPIRFRLLDRHGAELGRAMSWDMAGFDRRDGRLRCGLVGVGVPPELRGRGHAKFLLLEAMRYLRLQSIAVVEAQTGGENEPAQRLYKQFGFRPIGTSTLYRLPGPD